MHQDCFVFDSYALLAFLEGGGGCEKISWFLEGAAGERCQLFMSVINLGEVLYIVERERGLPKAQKTLARIDELPIRIIDVDRPQILVAAHIKARWPIAYTDCFAAALAKLKEAAVVTGDPEFKVLEAASEVSVTWL